MSNSILTKGHCQECSSRTYGEHSYSCNQGAVPGLDAGAITDATAKVNIATLVRDPKSHQGCLVDGIRGVYAGQCVQQIAMEYGWHCAEILDFRCERFDEAVQEAEDFLNQIAPMDWCFGWDIGDFFFMPVEWFGEVA